ncbi:MAG: glycosyltransferase family 39 protein [Gammaproteobacteria bacterium]|nr:glycosyltransferase family 39 protein [Gammaproteobacteria bacterium]
MAEEHDKPTHWIKDVLVLGFVIGLLFSFMLGSRAFWEPDEGRYVEIPREMVATGNYVTPRLDGVIYLEKPVLFYWMESASIKLFGLNQWSMRVWPALLGLLGCIAVYFAGRSLYGRPAGLIAATVLATNVLYYALARIITIDMPVTALVSISMLAFLLGTREPPGTRRRWLMWSFYAFAALALLAKGLIGIVFPGMVIGAWILIRNDWRLLRSIYLPSGLILLFAIAAPWHILVARANPTFLYYYFIRQHFERYLTTVAHRYEPVWFFIPIILAGLYPWTVFLFQAVRRSLPSSWAERERERDALYLLLWAGLIFVFFSFSDSKLIPYILPVFPPLAILIGRYLAPAWHGAEVPGMRAGLWALLAASIALAAVMVAAPRLTAADPNVGIYTAMLSHYLYAMAATLVVGSVAALVFVYRGRPLRSLAVTAVMGGLFLSILTSGLPLMDSRQSVKALAMDLKPLLGPHTEVMNYHAYYQDLPAYIGRKVTIVGFKGELAYGTTLENDSAWIIGDRTFWRRWQSGRTIYMLTTRKLYAQLRASGRGKFDLLATSGDNVLLTNNETRR